jgi:hypothetical protein
MRKLYLILFIAAAMLLASCGGSTNTVADGMGGGSERLFAATQDSPFVTELIAGAGQGWPGTGIDVGEAHVWNDGDNLHVAYFLDEEGWYYSEDEDLQLYVGKEAPEPPVAPGQFPFHASPFLEDGETDHFVLPLVGFYPAHGNDDPVAYDWTDTNLYIAAHGVVCQEVDGGQLPVSGVFATWDLDYGDSEIKAGWITLAIEGGNLVVRIYTEAPWTIYETQMYIGLEPPAKFGPGQWTYQHSPLLPSGSTMDTYTIPLSSIPAGPGDLLYIAIHATIVNSETGVSESAMAWDDDNWEQWKENNWKRYSWFYLPDPSGEPGEPYEICETMWGLDPVNGYDSVSANEHGWFPTFYDFAVKKWGWLFIYSTVNAE